MGDVGRRLVGAAVVAGALASCGTILSIAEEPPPAIEGGAGADGEGGGRVDGGAGGVDGAAEASPDPSWCEPGSLFCDDFERGAVGPAWDTVTAGDASVRVVDSSTATSGQRSLEVIVPAGPDKAYAFRALPPDARRIRMRFQVRNVEPPEGETQLAQLAFGDTAKGEARTFLFIDLVGPSALRLVEELLDGGASVQHPTNAGQLASDAWTRLVLTIDLDDKTLSLEGPSGPLALATLVESHGAGREVRVGVSYAAPRAAGRTVLRFDDVAVAILP